MTIIEELDGLPQRIATSAERYRELLAAAATEKKVRDQLIVLAVDEAGMTQAATARAAGLTQPTVVQILAAASTD
ncbi:putative transcriptional regulator [Nocardioides salarius]|uniref:Transcriptional regulator n=1 Tax=Nocardioides salarius TaxID=374513 RepID=A0ABS2MFT7_9ACTN|nr:hypothetical protein [Nocardioides salarius]MBM7510058.1 putative transcriptional regulator [Nocardioides salarius]